MVRTQLQMDEDTYEALRESAHKQKKSMSAVAREILRESLLDRKPKESDLKEKFSFISSGSSGESDISVNHDKYLEEAFS